MIKESVKGSSRGSHYKSLQGSSMRDWCAVSDHLLIAGPPQLPQHSQSTCTLSQQANAGCIRMISSKKWLKMRMKWYDDLKDIMQLYNSGNMEVVEIWIEEFVLCFNIKGNRISKLLNVIYLIIEWNLI